VVWRRVYWRGLKKSAAKSWKTIAASVGEAIPAARLHPRVRAWIDQHARQDEAWNIAVSGGSDSVALLLLLWAHSPEQRKSLKVLHFDHAVRPDSAADAHFVEALAKKLGVTFATTRRASGRALSEAALREDRWDFFREQLKKDGARIIFLGHQRDDIAEAMLMRLARGSGASGLCAPRPVREFPDGVVALRPLLDLSREELRAILKDSGAAWREDSSNAEGHHLRNRIRHQVIPAWQKAMGTRDLGAGVARAREMLEDDGDALEALAAAVMRDLPAAQPLLLSRLSSQPRAVVRRCLWWWLLQNQMDKNLNAHAFDALLDALVNAQPGRWSAGPGQWLVVNGQGLSLSDEAGPSTPGSWGPFELKSGQTLILPDGARLSARAIAVDGNLLKELKSGKIDSAKKAFFSLPPQSADLTLCVRSWRPGDRYRPLGAPGRRKLQDLFTDKKIPFEERHRLPVVCREDNEPQWVPGLPPAHARRVGATTRTALELTYSS
jgi:tRNA(Ile)-lysidine synthase